MSNPTQVTVDGVEYRRIEVQGEETLLVLDRGFIFVGKWDGEVLTQAYNVRGWSSEGIGGLTKGYESSGATLDAHADLKPHSGKIIYVSTLAKDWRSS